MSRLLSCIAALAIGFALTISEGRFVWVAIPPLLLAVVLSVVAAFNKGATDAPNRTGRQPYVTALFVIGALGSLIWSIVDLADMPADAPLRLWLLWLHVLELMGVVIFANIAMRFRPAVFAALLCVFTLTGILVIRANPSPAIDTWYFQQDGAHLLARGINPYAAAYRTPYSEAEIAMFFGPGVVENGLLMSYAYPPLNLLYQLPFFLIFGDVRYSILLAVILSALFIRRLALPLNRFAAECALLFMLFEPATLYVIRQAWTEPIVLAFWSAAILCVRMSLRSQQHPKPGAARQALAGVALGLLATIKQYCLLLFLPALLPSAMSKRPGRQILIATCVAAFTVVPFFIWNPAEFMRGAVLMQFRQPFRLDALSLLSVIARVQNVSSLPALALLPAFLAPVLLLVLTRPAAGRLDQIASTTAAGFITFVFLNKQSFCNYYWLALGLLCAACACAENSSTHSTASKARAVAS